VRVRIAERAEADLAHQLRWYQDHAGEDGAEQFLAAFDDTVSRLIGHPFLGKPRSFRAAELEGIRSLAVHGRFAVHLIFYKAERDVLSIERVMHGARDFPRRLLEAPDY
jgi:plasmid stabilization system protein ParE